MAPRLFPKTIFPKSFFAYSLARVLNMGSWQILSVVVGWQVYLQTSNPLNLGLVGLFQFLPRLLLVFHAGRIADMFDRRKIIFFVALVEGSSILALALLSWWGIFNLGLIFLILFFLGVCKSLEFPAFQAHLPSLVDKAILTRAIAMAASMVQFSIIVSPAIGGFLYLLGVDFSYLVCGLLVFISGFLILQTVSLNPQLRPKKADIDLFSGVQFIWNHPILLGAISLDLFAVLLGGATALLPVVAKELLDTNSVGLGLLRSAPALGALLMSLYLAKVPLKKKVGKKLFYSIFVFGVSTLLFSLSTNLWLSTLFLVALGGADMVNMVIRGSLLQLGTPDEMRGRVSAINSLFIGASNQLGEFESGLTAALFGLIPALMLGGFGSLLIGGLWIYFFPSLWKKDNFDEPLVKRVKKQKQPYAA